MVGPFSTSGETVWSTVPSARRAGDMSGVTSGRQTLGQIEQAIEDLRSKEQALQSDLKASTERRAKLMEARIATYRELAEVRARHAISDGVIDEADRLSHRVEALLLARQNTINELNARQAQTDAARDGLIRDREALSERIETLEAQLDQFALEAREVLSKNPEYRRELEVLEQAATTFARASDKAVRAEESRVEKGRAYENDLLFMYLWQRKFGTASYEARGLTRWLDGLVAGLVKYHEARANYSVLNEIPVRLKEHVGLLGEAKAQAQEVVDRRETAMIREMAKADVPAKLRDARAAENALQTKFERVTGELSDIGEQLNGYAEGQDAAFKKAVDMSAEFLGQRRTTELMQLTRQSSSPSDDQIASRIGKLDADIATVSSEIDRMTVDLEGLFDKRDELVRIAADFRRARYDDGASTFRGSDVGTILLQELIRGAITGADYWARSRRRQSWRRRPADSYRRSESFPPFDDLFGGSGGDSDDWSFGDDDFGTGGGF